MIIIKSGRLLNPMTHTDAQKDIRIENDRIVEISDYIDASKYSDSAPYIIDAYGSYVMPGLIDLHVHLRDPGFEYKETIETGAKAALRGGYTTICAMPNTKPVTDNPDTVRYIINEANNKAITTVLPIGSVTKGQMGTEIADIASMKYVCSIKNTDRQGICAISEDGKSVMNSQVYREAMINAKRENLPVFAHCEDINLVNGGSLSNDIPNAVEDIITARDIILAKETGARLHLCHISTRDSVDMLRKAKAEGLPVTGEITPHHFSLCEEDVNRDDTNYKMNPPVRSREDKEALLFALKNDIVDVIATDHAPHSEEEKHKSMHDAPFGIVGLETAVPLAITNLVMKGIISPLQMAAKMSTNPAMILGLDRGNIDVGKVADITIINPNEQYVIDAGLFTSKGKNTPFNGWKVYGKVKYVIKNGEVHHD